MTIPYEIIAYKHKNGREPFYEWLYKKIDRADAAEIEDRLDLVETGTLGDHTNLGGGLYELKVHYGPGYRIYVGKIGNTILLLLHGGTKRHQNKDIEKAREYLLEYKKGQYEQIKRKRTRIIH